MNNPLHYATCTDGNCTLCMSERAAAAAVYSVARREHLASWAGDKTVPATVALVMAVIGLVVWPLCLAALPLALYATRGRNGHRPLGHRQAVTAAALASLELAGLALLIVASLTFHTSL